MTTDVPPVSIEEKPAADAAEFWRLLSPEKPLFPAPSILLYRGQGNASWPLEPSILRHPENKLGVVFRANGEVASDDQVIKEWVYLSSFVKFCDSIGLPIPNDSPELRRVYLDQPGPGMAFIQTTLWPDPNLYGLLALAQHHGVPTRLLDWSTRSYVAAYFAISDALRNQKCTTGSDRLAVWVLDITRKGLYPNFETVKVPGGSNANLAAQAGMFTLLRQAGIRGKAFKGTSSLDAYFLDQPLLPMPLVKVTLPIHEATAALALCDLYGITGATIYPDYYGAARAARDVMLAAWIIDN